MNELEKEKNKLKYTLIKMKQVLLSEKENLENLYNKIGKNKIDNDNTFHLISISNLRIKNLNSSLNNPYFARLDFKYKNEDIVYSVYIGKYGISDNKDIIVTDWRAPISALYYDSEIGECSFNSPGGIQEGYLSLKRQYDIEKGELIDYFDVNLVSNDLLLQKYLQDNNDNRLKNIVATIQKEQNKVIRENINENLIVQGVAGSGKTTVALHRLAYLAYNYDKYIKQDQYMIIGPNPVFLKYINSVLPDLDVGHVKEFTFEDFAKKFINEDIIVNSSEKKANKYIGRKINNDIDKFKCSLKFKYMIDNFLEDYINNIFNNDIKIKDFIVLKKERLFKIYNSIDKEYAIDVKLEQTINKTIDYIINNQDEILHRYREYIYDKYKDAKDVSESLRKETASNIDIIKKGCRTLVKKYFSSLKVSSTKLYSLFINAIDKNNIFDYNNILELKKETLSNIKKKSYDFEDLSALIYLRYKLFSNKDYKKYRHIVLDEAQDLGEFNFSVLKDIFESATFSIFGDLAQSIYDYRGIDNWDTVNNIMFNNNAKIQLFNKSYRTTREIMKVADDIAESIGLNRSDMVIRQGSDVIFTKVDSGNLPLLIKNKIEEFINKGYKTVAVISKTNLLSMYINDDLKELGLDIPNVSINDDVNNERFRICTISNGLAKGLEFDAVIINNASENIYSSDNNLDMKLLYVAVTRALHELDITYTDELTKPLVKSLHKRTN